MAGQNDLPAQAAVAPVFAAAGSIQITHSGDGGEGLRAGGPTCHTESLDFIQAGAQQEGLRLVSEIGGELTQGIQNAEGYRNNPSTWNIMFSPGPIVTSMADRGKSQYGG